MRAQLDAQSADQRWSSGWPNRGLMPATGSWPVAPTLSAALPETSPVEVIGGFACALAYRSNSPALNRSASPAQVVSAAEPWPTKRTAA